MDATAHALVCGRRTALALTGTTLFALGKPVSAAETPPQKLDDLDAPAFEPLKVVSLQEKDAAKKETPASRIKALQAKKDLTKQEKSELRRLKADEMCELLGKGC